MNLPWTHAGLPVITLPAGKAANGLDGLDGLPLGLQCAADFMADEKLVGWTEGISGLLA
jgi:Asp-tRNA(Asn)/Glu-tRNA(Gln) amidotransferase A subunit family amidase